jgi:hypothetical protein
LGQKICYFFPFVIIGLNKSVQSSLEKTWAEYQECTGVEGLPLAVCWASYLNLAWVLGYLFSKLKVIELALLISTGCHEIIDTRNFAIQI